jgi:hypothetical protein
LWRIRMLRELAAHSRSLLMQCVLRCSPGRAVLRLTAGKRLVLHGWRVGVVGVAPAEQDTGDEQYHSTYLASAIHV